MNRLIKLTITALLVLLFFMKVSFAQNPDMQAPPVIPFWAFGHWIWEDEKNTREAVELLVDGYRKNNIPVGAIIVDSPWMNSYNDFVWDETKYPQTSGDDQ